jgi:hypothetical protein
MNNYTRNPNTLLGDQREIVDKILRGWPADVWPEYNDLLHWATLGHRLAELQRELDDALSAGGALPSRWLAEAESEAEEPETPPAKTQEVADSVTTCSCGRVLFQGGS